MSATPDFKLKVSLLQGTDIGLDIGENLSSKLSSKFLCFLLNMKYDQHYLRIKNNNMFSTLEMKSPACIFVHSRSVYSYFNFRNTS